MFSTESSSGLPSPTLTNPEMILPYADSRASTPSPPPQAFSLPRAYDQYRLPLALSGRPSPEVKYARPAPQSNYRSITPQATYRSGTPLENIEEVDASEDGTRSDDGSSTSRGGTLEDAKKGGSGSASTYSDDSDTEKWSGSGHGSAHSNQVADNDYDGVRGAQGRLTLSASTFGTGNTIEAAIKEEADDDDDGASSYAVLSQRAETILANAKKRLDNMEGNLSRARRSLIISPSSPMSSNGEHTDQRPPRYQNQISERRIHPALGVSPAKHRQLYSSPLNPSGSPGHSRVFSETSVPSSLNSVPDALRREPRAPRSTSALSSIGVARSTEDGPTPSKQALLRETRSQDFVRERSIDRRRVDNGSPQSLNSLTSRLQELAEVESLSRDLDIRHQTTPPHDTEFVEARNGNGLVRSRSAMQMQDLRVQMKDLKGKISTLQQRAREEGLKRRSVQSLRNSSPFTDADVMYDGMNGLRASVWGQRFDPRWQVPTTTPPIETPPIKTPPVEASPAKAPPVELPNEQPVEALQESDELERYMIRSQHGSIHDAAEGSDYGESDVASHYEDAEEPEPRDEEEPQVEGVVDDASYDDASPEDSNDNDDETAGADGEEEFSEDEDYHDASSPPVGERHEDRADAFDYEHFFLHSSVAAYGLDRRGSYSSTSSDATTRGPQLQSQPENNAWAEEEQPQQQREEQPSEVPNFSRQTTHRRTNSKDSVSTFATFATATEGLGSDDGSDGEEENNDDEWMYQQQQPPQPIDVSNHESYSQYLEPDGTSSTYVDPASRSETSSDTSTVINAERPDSAIAVNTPTPPTRSPSARSFPLISKASTPSSTGAYSSHSRNPTSVFTPADATTTFPSSTSGISLAAIAASLEQLKGKDLVAVENLLESLNRVCSGLSVDGGGGNINVPRGDEEQGEDDGNEWRRRIEDARRVLDGEDKEEEETF
ncbi:MAG: hypothetical protein M1819_000189 [Sarea resinae]|nr:MAG: hypothetical protein M1819_000189 [Sarea resinae]